MDKRRRPVIARALGKARRSELVETFENLVISIRRKALAFDRPEARAAIVDDAWRELVGRFRRAGVAHEFAAVLRRCLRR